MLKSVRSRVAALLGTIALAATPIVLAAPAANAAVGGTVTCDAYSSSWPVTGVWIDSTNNAHDGWASWSAVAGQPWKANFSKSDVAESYRVFVGCGGTTQSWRVTTTSGWVNGYHDFICHVSTTQTQTPCDS